MAPRAGEEVDRVTVTFPCPLCADAGETVAIVAEIVTLMGVPMVADLSGCEHATRFGELGELTLDEERRLIYASVEAIELPSHGDEQAEADAG